MFTLNSKTPEVVSLRGFEIFLDVSVGKSDNLYAKGLDFIR